MGSGSGRAPSASWASGKIRRTKRLHRLQTSIQVDRPEHGLEETGQDGVLLGATTAPLRAAEANVVAEFQAARLGGEHHRIDEAGARPGEIALRPFRVRLVEESRNGQIQHGVSQELETLVRHDFRRVRMTRTGG